MKRYFKRFAIYLIALIIITCLYPCAALAYSAPDFDLVDEQIRADVEAYHIPGMAVIVVNADEVLFEGTYGDCGNIDTPFLIGSMSKSFTALAIMQLVEEGNVDLEKPLSTYVDTSLYLKDASDGDRITVRQLLNHTSGLGTYQRFGNAHITDTYGTYCYANVNYGLLSKVIEAVSGKSYSDYVEEYIFSPLGMKHSSATLADAKADGLIKGYRNYFGIPIAGEPDYPTDGSWSTVAAGYIDSSVSDMGKYLQMYLNGGQEIISSKSINAMFYENVPEDDSREWYYGMGWGFSETYLDEPVLNHAGLVENFTSSMFLLPESGIGVVILVNMNDYLVDNNMLGNVIMPLLGGDRQEFSGNPYIRYHLLLDLIFLLILAIAVTPVITLKSWKNRNQTIKRTILDIARHGLLPAIMICLPTIIGVPFWVIWYFVKDLFLVVVTSTVLLLGIGIFKLIYRMKSLRF